MSDWTIWGHKAHLILEVEGRTIEVARKAAREMII